MIHEKVIRFLIMNFVPSRGVDLILVSLIVNSVEVFVSALWSWSPSLFQGFENQNHSSYPDRYGTKQSLVTSLWSSWQSCLDYLPGFLHSIAFSAIFHRFCYCSFGAALWVIFQRSKHPQGKLPASFLATQFLPQVSEFPWQLRSVSSSPQQSSDLPAFYVLNLLFNYPGFCLCHGLLESCSASLRWWKLHLAQQVA